MAIKSKNNRPSPVKDVRVSEASHRDARPDTSLEFETYREELDHWILRKKTIESELSMYSKASFSSAQARIRRENKGNSKQSFDRWISKKASMETKRQKLVKRKNECEHEIIRLKPLVKTESIRTNRENMPEKNRTGDIDKIPLFREDGTLSWDGVACEILKELRLIRESLEAEIE